MSEVHTAANDGYGRSAETYVRGRPDYPPATLAWLREDLGLRSGKKAVELGAGTGKFTRLMVETDATVIAVEPVMAMREKLSQDLPGVTALQGTAQRIPMPDATADAVVCAQSFHWFASAESLSEIRRVLKPGGTLGLIWNVRDQSVGWMAELTRIMAPYEGDDPGMTRASGAGYFRRRASGNCANFDLCIRTSGRPSRSSSNASPR